MSASVQSVLKRNLVFVSGKGGVGKTVISQAIALALAERGKKTLWTTFEDPTRPQGEMVQLNANLWHLNCEAARAFEEYAAMKIGVAPLARIFLQNKLMRYLSKAAPGIHELVLLGKVWHERVNFDHIIVDMPSTGYGVTMFQSTVNFTELFQGGPIYRDAEQMLSTFRDPSQTGQLIVALPEEMPLTEGMELNQFLLDLFPRNPPALLVNRLFPGTSKGEENPDSWPSPVARTTGEYVSKRLTLEAYNLRLWQGHEYSTLPFLPPPADEARNAIIRELADQLQDRRCLT